MTDEDQANVFGRLTALEMMTTNFLTMTLGHGTPKPLESLEEFKQTMFSSAQNLERPVDEFSDQCWAETVRSLELIFDNTHKRLVSLGFQE